MTRSSSSKKLISHETLIEFLVFGGFTDLSLKKGQPFIIWFYPPLLDYDVSTHGIVELVVVNPMSPRSSKTEPECSCYRHLCIAISSRIIRPIFAG
jgi:hypothetical protein